MTRTGSAHEAVGGSDEPADVDRERQRHLIEHAERTAHHEMRRAARRLRIVVRRRRERDAMSACRRLRNMSAALQRISSTVSMSSPGRRRTARNPWKEVYADFSRNVVREQRLGCGCGGSPEKVALPPWCRRCCSRKKTCAASSSKIRDGVEVHRPHVASRVSSSLTTLRCAASRAVFAGRAGRQMSRLQWQWDRRLV